MHLPCCAFDLYLANTNVHLTCCALAESNLILELQKASVNITGFSSEQNTWSITG